MSLAKRFLSFFAEHRRLVKEIKDLNQALQQMPREIDLPPRTPDEENNYVNRFVNKHPANFIVVPAHSLFLSWDDFKAKHPQYAEIGAFVDKVRAFSGTDLKEIEISPPPFPNKSQPGSFVVVFKTRTKASLNILEHIGTMLRLYKLDSSSFLVRARPGEVTVTFHNPVWFKKFLPGNVV